MMKVNTLTRESAQLCRIILMLMMNVNVNAGLWAWMKNKQGIYIGPESEAGMFRSLFGISLARKQRFIN